MIGRAAQWLRQRRKSLGQKCRVGAAIRDSAGTRGKARGVHGAPPGLTTNSHAVEESSPTGCLEVFAALHFFRALMVRP